MKKLILFVAILILFTNSKVIAQTSKKESIKSYQQIAQLDIVDVKSGKYLELATPFSIEEFIEYYAEHGKESYNKKQGHLTIEELVKDSVSTYFGLKNYYGLFHFFKVLNSELANVNYSELDGKALRQKFIDEIVPEEDKKRVERKENYCTMGYSVAEFDYKYYRESKELQVSYRWKISCDFLYKIINKTYSGKYNLDSNEFVK